MLHQFKSPMASIGVWGGAFALAAGVGSLLGYSITQADQKSIMDLVEGAVSVIGGAVAIYGRIRATKRIG